MKKKASSARKSKPRVHSTKKALSAISKGSSLRFREVTTDELRATRNSAYAYLVR